MAIPDRTMYQPLIDFLATQSEREVTLTFGEIEVIIGRPLSVSALMDPGACHRVPHLHVRRWRAIGWRARYDRRNQCVHFTRDAEEESR
jgi:hypothetical protein